MSDLIYLIGPMGVGKTTIGRVLAKLRGVKFIDCDQLLEKKRGVSISHIFEIEGEVAFRDLESRLIHVVSDTQYGVISTGGGVVLNSKNVCKMRDTGFVVYLHAPFNILWQRLKHCKTRPMLRTVDPQKTLKDLIVARDPLYSNAAHLVIEVKGEEIDQITEKIHNKILDIENENGRN